MICAIADCTGPVLARGWCCKHYWRWHDNGHPLTLVRVVHYCAQEGCTQRCHGRGLCHYHYSQLPDVKAQVNALRACRPSLKAQRHDDYLKHRKEYAARSKAWAKAHPARRKDSVRRNSSKRRAQKIVTTVEDISKQSVSNLFESVNGRCVYCGAKADLTLDHVVPLSRGGTHTLENLVGACFSCNSSKGNKLIEEWLIVVDEDATVVA